MRLLTLFVCISFAVACGHATSVRPTPKGMVQVEAELGGPVANVAPGLTLPVPLSTAGVRYGMDERYDLAAHVHLTSLSFGVAGLDVGSTWLAVPQSGAIPGISLSGRLYGFANLKSSPRAYLEVTGSASYLLGDHFLTYVSSTGLVQFAGGLPLWSLAAGEELRFGRFGLQAEFRWYEPNIATGFEVVDWLPIAGQGAWGVLLGLNYRFGG